MAQAKKFLSAFTRRRIQKMIALVVAQPLVYDQNSYPENGPGETVEHVCQTPFCAAGFAVFANDPKRFRQLVGTLGVPWKVEALKALKISDEDQRIDTTTMFGGASDWPQEFSRMYWKAYDAKTLKTRARRKVNAFVARWQNILDTDGADIRGY